MPISLALIIKLHNCDRLTLFQILIGKAVNNQVCNSHSNLYFNSTAYVSIILSLSVICLSSFHSVILTEYCFITAQIRRLNNYNVLVYNLLNVFVDKFSIIIK